MSTKVSPLGLRLFLEGVEVPVISASVNVQPDSPATAAIQIIPTDMALQFLPRTLVHLFYLDTNLSNDEWEQAAKAADKNVQTRTGPHGADEIDRFELQDFAYKIMFTGEVIGYNYKKTPSGRQLVLQCMDLSSYWDTCYQFFSDYSPGGSGLTDKHHHFVGAGSGLFDNIGGHQWVISKLLNSKPKSPEYQQCKGLLGGLIHLLEAVGGLRYRDSSFEGYNGVNDFFTIAELRYGLLSMLGAIQADETSAKLFAHKAFNAWLRNGMTSIGNLISFRDMLNFVNRHILHNIYPNPCAYYVPGKAKTKRTVRVSTTTFLDAAEGPKIQADLQKVLTSMVPLIGIMEEATSSAEVQQFELSTVRAGLLNIWEELRRNTGIVDRIRQGNSADVAGSLREITGDVNTAIKTLPTSQSDGDQMNKTIDANDKLKGAYGKLYELLNKSIAKRQVSEVQVPAASFLFNQLFLPEVFFVTPPRCNVIFPDQYFDLNYSRNFMREVSRLASTAGLGMIAGGRQGASLFNHSYIAPPIKDVKGQLLLATMSQGARVILPHEVHSGIIPKFEWVSEGHRWGVKAQKGKVEKVHYLQRLANYQFYLHRWSARQLAISGVFNPNIVAGLPSVIIDRSAPSPAVLARLEKLLRRRMLPTQFVGKIYSYSHSIGQGGGSTSIQFAYARTHRGLDDEFLGVMSKEIPENGDDLTIVVHPRDLAVGADPAAKKEQQSGTESSETDKARASQAAKTSPLDNTRKLIVRMWAEKKLKANNRLGSLGVISNVKETGSTLLTKTMALALGLSEDTFNSNPSKRVVDNTKAGTVTTVATLNGVEVIDAPEQISVTYHRVVGSGRYERNGLAFEDVIRPSWFSDNVWSNENITEAVYGPLLGTYAITDDVSLGQEQQDEMLKRWETDQTARVTVKEDTTDASGAGTTQVESSADGKFKYAVVEGSMEETIDGISLLYGMIKEQGGDAHDFIREFTRRPIANMVDILGTQNLEFDDMGKVKDPDTMIEGFHSRAFGDYNTDVQLPEKDGSAPTAGAKALHALMEGVSDVAGKARPGVVGREGKNGIRAELDPRGRARGRVRAYVEELQVSRGLLGS